MRLLRRLSYPTLRMHKLMKNMQTLFRYTLLFTLLLAFSACGFKLRGSVPQLDKIPSPISIIGIDQYTNLYQEINRQMQKAGVEVVAQNGNSVLRISEHKSRSRLMSLDSNNDALERELEESFQFSLRHPDQSDLAETQQVRVLRILNQAQDERLSSDREAEQLRKEMRRDLVNQMMRRLYALQKQP